MMMDAAPTAKPVAVKELFSRLLRWACYQLVRLAIGVAGYGGKH